MSTDETLSVDQAALLLRAENETVMQFARRGELPGARIGKSWVFMREDVLAFLRRQIASNTEARRRERENPPVAVAVPVPRHGRRKPIPVLPELPDPTQKLPKARS